MLEFKNTLTEMNDFDELISRPHTVEKVISDFEDISVKTSKTKMKREKQKQKLWNSISKNCGPIAKSVVLCVMDIPEGEEWEKETEKII